MQPCAPGVKRITWAEVCKAVVDRTSGPIVLSKQMKVEELGFDSLEILEFMVELGIPQDKITEIETLGDLLAWEN